MEKVIFALPLIGMQMSEINFMPMFTAHEDRLQRLEAERSGIAALEIRQTQMEERLASVEEKLEDLYELRQILVEVSTTMRFFGEKMDTVNKRLMEKHQSLEQTVDSVIKENRAQSEDIKEIKRAEERADKRFDWKMKFLFGTGAATGGALLGLVIEYLKKKMGF